MDLASIASAGKAAALGMFVETRCHAGQSLRRVRWIAFMARTYALPRPPLIFIIDDIDSISLIGIALDLGKTAPPTVFALLRPRVGRATKAPTEAPSLGAVSLQRAPRTDSRSGAWAVPSTQTHGPFPPVALECPGPAST
jgi:hypothetical protein